jgi:hypothetical protein
MDESPSALVWSTQAPLVVDEQMFRYNNRKMNDGDRFNIVVHEIVGKRLTWNQLHWQNGGCHGGP